MASAGRGGRSTVNDGWKNKIEARVLTRFRPAWSAASAWASCAGPSTGS